ALATHRPEIIDIVKTQRRAFETDRREALHHQCLTAVIGGGDGAAADQVESQFECRGQGGHGIHRRKNWRNCIRRLSSNRWHDCRTPVIWANYSWRRLRVLTRTEVSPWLIVNI